MSIMGRHPSRNLLTDGYEEVADFIARQIKRDKVGYAVHVAETGTVRITRTDRFRAAELPNKWLVGSYPYTGMRVEFIEDDLLERQREIA